MLVKVAGWEKKGSKMGKIVLSICIALHNRSSVVNEHIRDLLSVTDDRFDIIVSDSSDEGKDLQSLYSYDDARVKLYKIDADTPAMMNWKSALDHADGIFSFHLNDRDVIYADKLVEFIDFLENHSDCNGGVCKYLSTCQEPKLFMNGIDAFMNVPFFASHPTGIVFNVDKYREIEDLGDIFDKNNGIHPHDIILARLSQYGKMFIYTKKVWELASAEFYKKNVSGFESKKTSLFFEPKERIFELKQNLKAVKILNFADRIKQDKTEQMYRTYLALSTSGYFYFLESEHETAHYGIAQQKIGTLNKYRLSMEILESFATEFHFSNTEKKTYKKWLIKSIMIPVIAKYTSRINNPTFRNVLRRLRVKRESDDSALLR
ncbi:hypothetical protein SELR_05910 [Selenomonas ruminantium subsp. lactilytica TAM6421]|uniref:Glycosyl transferase family 2 n=1 Tax=Selenomonas ruminantium subsp. lactilytica (strain NBRC 103574 / TAM6421) TaxID=927704 RepID=I0GNG2_SELRL|nr:glycosyltransferase family 2 protein [Selenomonas ruminantium]BAL82299.1 hypothetical protein SELR_05910 [Selenomonas ruminantium subsp. lactilytica TAM6421]